MKPGTTQIHVKESNASLGVSPFKFALTSAADPLGLVRRGWSLLSVLSGLGGQGLEPS